MPHSPSPEASIQPTGPAYRPAVHALDLVDQRDRGRRGRAADGGGGVQRLGQLQRGGRQLGVLGGVHDAGDVGGQVHDVRAGAARTAPRARSSPEQCGSSASATERTAYSCSSRSFDDRARVAASARSRSSSPVRRMVPASTREVTRPRSRRTSISGVAPNMPSTWKVQHMGYVAARRCSGQRTSIGSSAVATRSRASTTFSRSPAPIRETASATTDIHCSPLRAPSAKLHGRGGAGSAVTAAERVGDLADGGQPGAVAAAADDDPRQHQHRLAGLVGERERPEADRAGAGLADLVGHLGARRSSRTTTWRRRRTGSDPTCGSSAATPQPTRPSPRRSQVTGASAGSRSTSSPAGRSSATVRATRVSVGGGVGGHEATAYAAASRPPIPEVSSSRR